jgi:hypothetical protein
LELPGGFKFNTRHVAISGVFLDNLLIAIDLASSGCPNNGVAKIGVEVSVFAETN